MKQVNEMPTEGQFVAVYKFNDNVWSGVYKYEHGELYEYDTMGDSWEKTDIYFTGSSAFSELKFFV